VRAQFGSDDAQILPICVFETLEPKPIVEAVSSESDRCLPRREAMAKGRQQVVTCRILGRGPTPHDQSNRVVSALRAPERPLDENGGKAPRGQQTQFT